MTTATPETPTVPEAAPVERLWARVLPPHGLSRTALTIIAIVIAVDVLGLVVAWQILTSDWAPYPVAAGLIAIGLGWAFAYAGVIAWARNPDNRVGTLMIGVGFSWLLSQLLLSDVPAIFTFGHVVMAVPFVLLGHLLLAFPSGRLESPLARANLALGWFAVGVCPLLWLPLADSQELLCGKSGYPVVNGTVNCPENLLMVSSNPDLALTLLNTERSLGLVAIVITIGILVQRWRTRSAAWRNAVAPVLAAGAVLFCGMFIIVADDVIGMPLGVWSDWVFQGLMALLPLAFLVGFMRARHTAADLAASLAAPSGGTLCARLRRAVRDPGLDLVYPRGPDGQWIDAEGRPRQLPAAEAGRMTTPIRRGGETVACLIHDAALGERPELVETISRGAALALENERLSAELRARLEELRDSRARIVEAGDHARRQIERNLHDGTQARLSSIMMELGLADSRFGSDPDEARALVAGARENLAVALQELRELSQGVHPGVLTERGLAVAVKELTYRHHLPIELDMAVPDGVPSKVEATAYYVVAEAVANAAKHADATSIAVVVAADSQELILTVSDDGVGGALPGGGLAGLADRVEALGGRLAILSPPRGGTRLSAALPLDVAPDA